MGQTIRDLGNTINNVNQEDEFLSDDKNAKQSSPSKSMGNDSKNSKTNEKNGQLQYEFSQDDHNQNDQFLQDGMRQPDDDEEVIDIDNPEQLAAKGLKRI